jgi:hypothetical protein
MEFAVDVLPMRLFAIMVPGPPPDIPVIVQYPVVPFTYVIEPTVLSRHSLALPLF